MLALTTRAESRRRRHSVHRPPWWASDVQVVVSHGDHNSEAQP